MFKKIISIAVILAVLPASAAFPREKPEKRGRDIVATVNGDEIKKVEYGKWLFENANTFMLIENYLSTLLFREKADELGVEVSAEDIERALDEKVEGLLERWKKNEKTYLKMLNKKGITEDDFKEELKENNIREVTSDLYASGIIYHEREITEDEIKEKFYDKCGKYGRKYRIRHIYKSIRKKFLSPGEPGYDYSLEKADETVLKKIRRVQVLLEEEGADNFALIAKEETDDLETRYTGGLIGIFNINRYGGEFDEVVPTLRDGEISGILKSNFGYHIVKVNSIENNDINISHITAKLKKNYVKNIRHWDGEKKKAINHLNTIRNRIRGGADFEIIAENESDDYSSVYGSDISSRWKVYDSGFMEELKDSDKGSLKILESSRGIHLVFVEDIKVTEYTDTLKEELRAEIKSGIAGSGEIIDLAVRLLKENKVYYKL